MVNLWIERKRSDTPSLRAMNLLSQRGLADKFCDMSAVELALKKVKGLSEKRVEELLQWLDHQAVRPHSPPRATTGARGKTKRPQSIRKLMAWYDSIRGTTDWEPPRMPDDLVQRVKL